MRNAIITFLVKDGKVLLIHSFYNAARTQAFWQGISGYVEAGEDSVAAAVREAKEELNIDINPNDLTHKHSFTSGDAEFQVYTTDTWQGEFKIGEAGLEELRWFSFDELPLDQMHPGDEDWLPGILSQQAQ